MQYSMYKCDTFTLDIGLNVGSELEPTFKKLESNEYFYIGIMGDVDEDFSCATIRKIIDSSFSHDDNNLYKLVLNPSDTENLRPGLYYLCVKYIKKEENDIICYVKTIIPETQFYILD